MAISETPLAALLAYNIREAALERGIQIEAGDISWLGSFGSETRQAIVSALHPDLYIDGAERWAILRTAAEPWQQTARALITRLQEDPPSRYRDNYLREKLKQPDCLLGLSFLSIILICVNPHDRLGIWQEIYQLEQSRQWPQRQEAPTVVNTRDSISR